MGAKWIRFDEQLMAKPRKTKVFSVVNIDTNRVIGSIAWYGPFRQYSFFPEPNTVFERTCLQDITNFINDLMDKRKEMNKW